MHVHILGIAGTFMAGVALLARQSGFRVTGCDQAVYPPMSTQLKAQGIDFTEGYDPVNLPEACDLLIIGNALSRGNPLLEHVLNRRLPYISGPAFVHDYILKDKWVVAVAGTHGKTTTSSMLAWILDYAGLDPGFLIGGIPGNFTTSARLGNSAFFVIEADEYDTAFFDKRSKFIHYAPMTAVLNNLEFDHADIFDDIEAIKRQFHHFVRIVPGIGKIIWNGQDTDLAAVLDQGCWSQREYFMPREGIPGKGWWWRALSADTSAFEVYWRHEKQGVLRWSLFGQHNVSNALAAIAAARHAGVPPAVAIDALAAFVAPKRRMELRGEVKGIKVFDDFAHHPTAIAATLSGLRKKIGKQRIVAVLEPRSNTMRMGVHNAALSRALAEADEIFLYRPLDLSWEVKPVFENTDRRIRIFKSVQAIIEDLLAEAREGDHIVIMSNGGFENIHERLLQALQS